MAVAVLLIAAMAAILAANRFGVAGIRVLVVQSGSMEPAIKTASIVVVKPENDYREGDIVSFNNKEVAGVPITHRILKSEINGSRALYTTKGDANNAADGVEITGGDIIGKVWFSVPFLGYIIVTARKPYGFVALILFPACLIIFNESKAIIEELKRSKKLLQPHE